MRENSQETKMVAQGSKLILKTFKDQNKISTRVNKFFAFQNSKYAGNVILEIPIYLNILSLEL